MRVNGVPIVLEGADLDGRTFDIPKIRAALRELLPCTSEETMLCAAEATIFGTQLLAVEHYRYFPSACLFDLLFTGDLCVEFRVDSADGVLPARINIEEEYVLSEMQIRTRLSSGETIEDIERKNRDEAQTVELGIGESTAPEVIPGQA
jgi:hypothetical protein